LAEAKARIVQETTVTKAIASLIWVAGLFAWYTIRYPFEHRAKKLKVRKSLLDWRERVLLVIIFFGLFAIPAAYVLTGFPASLNYAFIPAVAWIGLLALSGSLWLFRRSHVDLGRNWSMSLEVREQHVLVKTGIYRLIRHPMYGSFFF
jgi:protein-S-isoprenylcysteine O-methyltransferase Ste14